MEKERGEGRTSTFGHTLPKTSPEKKDGGRKLGYHPVVAPPEGIS